MSVRSGLDQLLARPGSLKGRRLGLIANATTVTADLVHGARDDLNGPPERPNDPFQSRPAVSGVHPQVSDPIGPAVARVVQHSVGSIAILLIGRVNHRPDDHAKVSTST